MTIFRYQCMEVVVLEVLLRRMRNPDELLSVLNLYSLKNRNYLLKM